MYKRKTKDVWEVIGDYGYGYGNDVLTIEATRKDALQQMQCYVENDRQLKSIQIKKRRVRI
jgi:hypothetical protein